MSSGFVKTAFVASAVVLMVAAGSAGCQEAAQVKIFPATMPRVGSVDERFQSYNIEMVEVTGGRFWKPYAAKAETSKEPGGNQPGGMDPGLYMYRPPIDLSNTRLRKLAAALGPAYLRVSGTWANTTYFDAAAGGKTEPPPGFKGVLTGAEWKSVVEFAQAAHAELVTSFAMSAGTRDAAGVWTPAEAQRFVDFTKSAGGHIAAAEYMNEPTFAEIGGAPQGYDAAAYARDLAVFRAFAKKALPDMLLLGPGGVGEGSQFVPPSMKLVSTADIFTATGPAFDAVSYHSYGGVSSRCGGTTTADAAMSDAWLAKPDQIEQFYGGLRDRFEPGKPLWNTETAQTACGGDKWASTFLDSFRYLNQLGDLAKRGVQVHMHNTLAASDYGLLDENTYAPRPNYWAALLWRRLMGTTVLDAGTSPAPSLHLYAHCERNHAGGVTLLAINAEKTATKSIALPVAAERYTLTAAELMGTAVDLNGNALRLGADDALPEIKGIAEKPGTITLAPASITFLTFPEANNASCR